MPTPTRTFHVIAARYGKVDPNDPEAVRHWFTEVLPTLPPDTIEEIFEAVLKADKITGDKPVPRSYPQGIPLPSLSGSPAAATPILAAGLRELLNKLRGQSKKG